MNVAILGAGMVGRAMAIDLAGTYYVTSFDISGANLEMLSSHSVKTVKADLLQFDSYPHLLREFDMVVNSLPGFMGYRALEAIIRSKKNVADISFYPENALDLDALAKENNITAIVDCGVAPGMSNLLLGYYDTQMKIESFECLVGGLPKLRVKPFEYKAPFSPMDVIEEYTRPARYVENGHIVIKPALSDAEYIDIEGIGTLESFNTDGLRSILFTMAHIPDMKEKTLRYPGHIDLIKALQKAGFFDTDVIDIKGQRIRPVDFTSALLIDKWKLHEKEEEFTVMRVIIKGLLNNRQTTIEHQLYDEYDKATQISSMSRTTGYTCTGMLNLVTKGLFTQKGVFPPELVGKDKTCFEFILQYLEERKVFYKKKVSNEPAG